MSARYNRELRRLYYSIDPGYRARRKQSAAKAGGWRPPERITRDSWSIREITAILGVSSKTIDRYEKMGIIPKVTYPVGRMRRYWRHQAVLLIWLFQAMRMEGWPRRIPHFVGSRYWTLALARLRSEWDKEHPFYGHREVWSGDDNEEGKDGAG